MTHLENHEHQPLVSDPYDNRIIVILAKYRAVRRFSFLQNLLTEQISNKQIKCRKVDVSELTIGGNFSPFPLLGFIHSFRDMTKPLVSKKHFFLMAEITGKC